MMYLFSVFIDEKSSCMLMCVIILFGISGSVGWTNVEDAPVEVLQIVLPLSELCFFVKLYH